MRECYVLSLVIILFCTYVFNGNCELISETLPAQINGGSPVVAALENSTTTVVCEIFSSGNPFITGWRIVNGEEVTLLQFNSDGMGDNDASSNFVVTGEPQTTQANLTILVFTRSLNMNVLECISGQTALGNFTLRIIELPLLSQGSSQSAVEGSTFSLSVLESEGFPEGIISFMWFFNARRINDDSSHPNITLFPNIEFESVNRTDSGDYVITVDHEGGSVNGSFTLDVYYGPEAVFESVEPFYALISSNITLIAFSNIVSNPSPNSSWSKDDEVIVIDDRYSTSTLGQLTIYNLALTDTANYTNRLTNMFSNISISNIIELNVAEHPSSPQAVEISTIGAEFVNITWKNPARLGVPPLTQFMLVAESTINIVNVTISAFNNDNTNFINMYIIEGLKPSTEYSLTISALSSEIPSLGVLVSSPSETVMFNTTLGAPSISTAVLDNTNGNLSVSWTFLHTGGSDLDIVTVQCSTEGSDDTSVSTSTDPLAVIVYCSTNDDCITDSSVSVGPVTVGLNYSCLITAENSIGEDTMRTNYLIATTGVPSEAVIISVVGGAGVATLTVRVDNYGVLVASDYTFIVSVFNQSDTVNPIAMRTISPNNIDNSVVTILVVDLPQGTLVFTVASSNVFTNSPVTTSSVSGPVVVQPVSSSTITTSTPTISSTGPPPSLSPTTTAIPTTSSSTTTTPTTTLTAPTSIGTSDAGLSGGAIAGIVIGIIILLAIIAIIVFIVIFIIYQNRGGTYEVEKGRSSRPKVVVEEHDIDIGLELDDSVKKSHATATATTTAEAQPKQELHYADLADFNPIKKSNPSAPPTAKPMPIEEVQYACIRPQDQKKLEKTDASDENMM